METPKERAMDFIIRKFCLEEARRSEEYNAWVLQKTGKKSSFEYDAERDFQWIKEQQKIYDTAKQSSVVVYKNRAFSIIGEADVLSMFLLTPSARAYNLSGRAAATQRKQLKWFEESPEFKDLVPSALSRV